MIVVRLNEKGLNAWNRVNKIKPDPRQVFEVKYDGGEGLLGICACWGETCIVSISHTIPVVWDEEQGDYVCMIHYELARAIRNKAQREAEERFLIEEINIESFVIGVLTAQINWLLIHANEETIKLMKESLEGDE